MKTLYLNLLEKASGAASAAVNTTVPNVQNAVTGEQVTDNNALQGGASPTETLWQVVFEKAISRTHVKLSPIATTTYRVDKAFNYLPPSAGGAKPNILVPVLDSVGSVEKDATDDWKSDIATHNVAVPITRYSRSFGLSMFEVMKGEGDLEGKIAGVVDAIMLEMHKDFMAVAATAEGSLTVSEITPETVARQISAAFGAKGDVEFLALNPQDYAMLLPLDKNGFAVTSGVYGIGEIYKSQMPASVDALAWSRDGIAAAFGVAPYFDAPGVMFRTFTVEGIPFKLKVSFDAQHNQLYHTIDVLAGFAVANEDHIAVIEKEDTSG